MPGSTGIWSKGEAELHHDFSYRLAQWIADYLPKDQPVVDLGCGKATYLRYLHDRGFSSLLGVEGEDLPFEFGNVIKHDLTEPLNFAESVYDDRPVITPGNVISLEVGEHIPETNEKERQNFKAPESYSSTWSPKDLLPPEKRADFLDNYLNNVCNACAKDGKVVLSWAIPGQDGHGHVSNRSNVWVINEMEKRGFTLLAEDTLSVRSVIEERLSYFRNTLMIFKWA